ncbi:non-ribosomal peptide synthetase [Streptomyces lichenis]|uniref:Amino acid adenylation domain-containing protein n=1 Tax=Streptomyces lichenis TaxID=2306967 RepID=A0ABT0IE17_9ACTN|nr:non-ribosomal peptide synthetase [Streptomyces lichenis]MCK8679517.1 amino acid adenylation domain-containing protein [Streptomyces lichenis]
MTDPLLTVVLDRWRTTAGDPGAGPDDPLAAAHGEALAADLTALLGLPVAAEDIAGCGTPRELAELLRERRSGGRTPAPATPAQDPVSDEATAGQAGIWYACEYGDPTAYNSPVLLRLPGTVDPEALRRALTGVVARHESLRTTFAMEEAADGARLVQHIAEKPRFGFATATAADEDELTDLAAEFATTRFDLRAGPLLDVLVVETGSGPDSGTALLVNVHHAVFDGFSWSVLLTEWLAAYRLLAEGREVPKSPAPTQFREAVAARPRSEERERASLAYWTEHLADAPPPLELAPDRPRTTGPARTARTVRTVLDGPEADRLREAAAAGGVTPLVVLLTAYALLLHRQTGRRDLTVGLPVSLRDRAADQAAIGHLVNTVVLRHRIGSEATGRELLAATRDEVLGAMRHKDTAFEDVVRALGAGRDAGRSPLFQTMVTLMPKERRLLGPEGAEAWHHISGAPKYDLALIVEEGERELGLTFEYDPAVFRPGTVERVAARFRTLLAELTARPEAPVAELAWVPEEELAELAGVWHGAPDERAARTTVTALFEERATRAPEAPAVETVDGTVLSYGELNAGANRLARALAARGAGPGTRVAVRLERGPEAVTALLAVLKTGASVVPLDPSYPAERTALVLADARPGLLLVPGDQELDVPSGIERFDPAAEEQAVAGQADGDLPHRRSPGDEMYVVYTSGSTGRPKGVVINDLTLTNVACQQAELSGPHAGASMLQYMSLAFDVSFEEIFGALCAGAPLVLTDEEMRTDLHRLAHQLRDRRVARVFLPYAALQELASVAVHGGIELPDLKEVYTTGEQLVVTPQLREFFGRLTGAALVNAYGPSEAHLCTAYRLPPDPAAWPERPPIGHTVGGVRAYVLDGDGRPVPFGVPGELYVGGPVLSPGYLHLPEQTEARFRPDPFTDGPEDRYYRTGDLVRCDPDEGFTHLGRADEQIKIRGYRIEPAEVEAALNTLPGVSASAVVAAEYGPGDRRLVAFLRTEDPVDEPELRRALGRSLPGYLIPSRFAAVERLPLGPTGKVDRGALAARATELPAPVQDTSEARELTETEQRVAAVWTELLDGSAVGPDDDFFALGGHSLLAVRLRQRLQEAYGTELPLSALLATPTVAGMAARVEAALSGETVADTGPDLWADTRLPDTVDPSRAERHADPATATSVLLTGVTGFLGVYLLRSLLADGRTVHCLVRASSAEEGMERLRDNARRYRADDGLDLSRVRVVAGDLAEERFGLAPDAYRELAGSVEAVYHAAAHINFAAPYASVKPTNVDGFVRVAEFCADTVVKPLHLMSTLAVFSPEGPSDIDEETVPETPERLGIGYAQSKWVAERLALAARERGLPVTVHRIGRIGPATGTGAIRTDDFFWLQVKSFLKLGIAPERPGPPVDLLPADLVADAVVLLSRAEAAANGTTHVFHPVGMDWETVFEALASLGARPRPVSAEEWLAALEAGPGSTGSTESGDGDRSLASLVPLFREGVMELGDHRYGNESTVRLLKELGLELPPADPSWITSMVRYFEETGQLAAAPRTT